MKPSTKSNLMSWLFLAIIIAVGAILSWAHYSLWQQVHPDAPWWGYML